MANPLLKINQPADVKLGQKGNLNLGICWKADLAGRYTEAFERIQKEADGEFVRLVKPYIPLRTGALAGGIGMGLFDLISGWTAWAPFTLIIVGLMGYVSGLISEKLKVRPIIANTVAVIAALIIKIAGYYLAEGILFGNWVAPLGSIPGNIIQVATAGVIVIPFAGKLKQIAARY